jgi:hypothetical protein
LTRRRRTAGAALRFDPFDYLNSDGWTYSMFSGVNLLGSLAEAQSAWEQCRARCWRLWAEHRAVRLGPELSPPDGARAHDDLTAQAAQAWYAEPADVVLAAVDADLASLADFAGRRPRVHATVVDEVRAWSDDLEFLAGLAERFGDDLEARHRAFYGPSVTS